jgi:hypothetical protein
LRIEAPDLRVAVLGALLPGAEDCLDRVVDVEHDQLIASGQQPRNGLGQADNRPGGDCVELADVAEGERAQERSQRRRGAHLTEHLAHAAVAQ